MVQGLRHGLRGRRPGRGRERRRWEGRPGGNLPVRRARATAAEAWPHPEAGVGHRDAGRAAVDAGRPHAGDLGDPGSRAAEARRRLAAAGSGGPGRHAGAAPVRRPGREPHRDAPVRGLPVRDRPGRERRPRLAGGLHDLRRDGRYTQTHRGAGREGFRTVSADTHGRGDLPGRRHARGLLLEIRRPALLGQGDRIVPEGGVATAGEAHDVYVDGQGILYVFANETMQIIDPRSGQHLNDLPLVSGGDGGWRPFRDGAIVVPGPAATILKLAGGGIQFQQTLAGFGSYTWSVAFDGTSYLYQGDEAGRIHVDQVSVAANGTYNVVEVGAVQVPAVGSGANPLLALALQGPTLWALGPNAGLAAVDVSTPSAPKVVYQDRFTFATNGNYAGLVIARNRVYAGAGNQGVRIYDPSTLRLTGTIPGLNANFLDTLGDAFLVVANYWYPKLPEGVYVYDLRRNPDVPAVVGRFPRPTGNANFRARALGRRIYRVALYGVDILEAP